MDGAGAAVVAAEEVSNPEKEPDTYENSDFWGRVSERRAYHRQCDQRSPEDNFFDQFTSKENLCNRTKWELEKWTQCKQMRDAYTEKWYDGVMDDSHVGQMNQINQNIKRAEDNVRRHCGLDCLP